MRTARHRCRTAVVAGVGVCALLAVTAGTIGIGDPGIPPDRLVGLWQDRDSFEAVVAWEIRAPRAALGLAAGAACGVAGTLLQESLRNRFAAPEILGVGPGAALAVAAVQVFGLVDGGLSTSAVALTGALVGGSAVLGAAGRLRNPDGVLLVGAGVSAALSATLVAVMSCAEQFQAQALFRYLSGSLAGLTWDVVTPVLAAILVTAPLALLLGPALDAVRLGDATGAAVGVPVVAVRVMALALAVVLVALTVAAAGPLAWVAFLAPTAARVLAPRAGVTTRLVLSAAAGAAMTVTADVAARTAFAPIETPVGAWTGGAGLAVLALSAVRARRASAGKP